MASRGISYTFLKQKRTKGIEEKHMLDYKFQHENLYNSLRCCINFNSFIIIAI